MAKGVTKKRVDQSSQQSRSRLVKDAKSLWEEHLTTRIHWYSRKRYKDEIKIIYKKDTEEQFFNEVKLYQQLPWYRRWWYGFRHQIAFKQRRLLNLAAQLIVENKSQALFREQDGESGFQVQYDPARNAFQLTFTNTLQKISSLLTLKSPKWFIKIQKAIQRDRPAMSEDTQEPLILERTRMDSDKTEESMTSSATSTRSSAASASPLTSSQRTDGEVSQRLPPIALKREWHIMKEALGEEILALMQTYAEILGAIGCPLEEGGVFLPEDEAANFFSDDDTGWEETALSSLFAEKFRDTYRQYPLFGTVPPHIKKQVEKFVRDAQSLVHPDRPANQGEPPDGEYTKISVKIAGYADVLKQCNEHQLTRFFRLDQKDTLDYYLAYYWERGQEYGDGAYITRQNRRNREQEALNEQTDARATQLAEEIAQSKAEKRRLLARIAQLEAGGNELAAPAIPPAQKGAVANVAQHLLMAPPQQANARGPSQQEAAQEAANVVDGEQKNMRSQ